MTLVSGDTKPVKLSTTNATEIIGAQDQNVAITEIVVTEISGNADTFTIELYDGSTSYYIANTKPIASREVRKFIFNDVTGLPLRKGWTLRATAGTSNRLDVTASHTTV